MMMGMDIGRRKAIMAGTAILAVLVVGGIATLRGCRHPAPGSAAGGTAAPAAAKYQCPMHPQIIQDRPGKCPICHMDLEKVIEDGAGTTAAGDGVPGHEPFNLSAERQQLIGGKTGLVERRTLSRHLRLPGRATGSRGVAAELLELDAGAVKPGMKARLVGPREQAVGAVVTGVDPRFDALTRTFQVTLQASAPASWLKPGIYCEVDVFQDFGRKLAVPVDAVLYSGERQVVFVTDGNGRFEPREVRLGNAGEDWTEVVSGLKEGEQVVTSANFLIDSESRFKAALKQF